MAMKTPDTDRAFCCIFCKPLYYRFKQDPLAASQRTDLLRLLALNESGHVWPGDRGSARVNIACTVWSACLTYQPQQPGHSQKSSQYSINPPVQRTTSPSASCSSPVVHDASISCDLPPSGFTHQNICVNAATTGLQNRAKGTTKKLPLEIITVQQHEWCMNVSGEDLWASWLRSQCLTQLENRPGWHPVLPGAAGCFPPLVSARHICLFPSNFKTIPT